MKYKYLSIVVNVNKLLINIYNFLITKIFTNRKNNVNLPTIKKIFEIRTYRIKK